MELYQNKVLAGVLSFSRLKLNYPNIATFWEEDILAGKIRQICLQQVHERDKFGFLIASRIFWQNLQQRDPRNHCQLKRK